MAIRKSFLGAAPVHPELDRLLEATQNIRVSEEQLKEQRVSFAYGNAPADAVRITKDSVRAASESIRLRD
ncbi:MAG TPA: hypothetical protein VII40_02630 [Xanthobacteraceae bacterium]|jgi:hypothetical protein